MKVESILGDHDELRFHARRRRYVDIGWGDAAKHRQVVETDDGTRVEIMLPRGSFLRDGAVLADDGDHIVVVRRPPEPAITVRFADNDGVHGARRILLLGYLLGNQHAPIDVGDEQLAAPLFTSVSAAEELLADLGVVGAVTAVPMATHGWSRTSADSHAGHHH